MRHSYECPVRWADMDLLRHVNNVRWADYLQEARIDFLRTLQVRTGAGHEEGRPDSGLVVVRHELTYLAPLHLEHARVHDPVTVEVWVADLGRVSATLACEVSRDDGAGGRTVFLTARTRVAPFVFATGRPRRLSEVERSALAPYVEPPAPGDAAAATPAAAPAQVRRTAQGHYPVHVRFSDLDPYRHVNNVAYLEYFQEGRIALTTRLWADVPPGPPHVGLVVARAELDYLRAVVGSPGRHDLWTWVERIGTRSLVLCSQVDGADGSAMARARVVLVFVDPATGRPTEPPPAHRAALEAALAAAPGA